MLCRFCAVSGPTRNAKSRHGGIGKELLDNIFELWYKIIKATGKTHELAQRTADRWIQSRQTCGEGRGDAAGSIEARTGNLGPRSFLDHKAIREGVDRARRTSFPGHLQFMTIFLEFFFHELLTLL